MGKEWEPREGVKARVIVVIVVIVVAQPSGWGW
jgi:hypothetical protein